MFSRNFFVTSICLLAVVQLTACSTTQEKSAQAPASQSATQANTTASASGVGNTATTPANVVAPMATPPNASVYFDYDSAAIKDQFASVTRAESEYLQKSSKQVALQGNADERGSREYNMALGQKRATAMKRALTALGVKESKIDTASFGEDKPKAKGHDEAAWAENRRVDILNK